MKRRRRAGFTLIEVMIAVAILALIAVNISMVLKTSSSAYKSGVFASTLEDQFNQTLDRITLALMSSSVDELNPLLDKGLHTSEIEYVVSLGMEDGEVVLSDPEKIAFLPDEGTVVWTENPDGGGRTVVWAKGVPIAYDGELINGVDDNANGLVDEAGLSFEREGSRVNVLLTLQRRDSNGVLYVQRQTTTVTCRN